nr:hypothetical protein [Marinobacter sp. SS8-8]
MDRLLHGAHRLNLTGESLRKAKVHITAIVTAQSRKPTPA